MEIEKLIERARAGDWVSGEKLAWRYDQGIGVRKSFKKAFYWYKKSVPNKNPIVYYNLGLCYLSGQGIDRDHKKAFYWTKKAAEAGYSEGMVALGWHYHNGAGTEKNYELAGRWYMKSLEKSENAAAYFSLGQIAYDENRFDVAAKFFVIAMEKFNHSKSCYYLGRMYFAGKGVKKDLLRAQELLKKASSARILRATRLLSSKKFRTRVNA